MSELADFDVGDFNSRYAADRGVHARFYTFPVQDLGASAEQGRPIYTDKEFIEILAAGNANNIVQRKATSEDKQRFRRQYDMFKQGAEDQLIGTPLSEVPWLTRSAVEELAHLRVRSLEQLADLDDQVCGKVAGLYDQKRKAKAALEVSQGMAPITKLQAENDELKAQLKVLADQMKELTAALKKSGKDTS